MKRLGWLGGMGIVAMVVMLQAQNGWGMGSSYSEKSSTTTESTATSQGSMNQGSANQGSTETQQAIGTEHAIGTRGQWESATPSGGAKGTMGGGAAAGTSGSPATTDASVGAKSSSESNSGSGADADASLESEGSLKTNESLGIEGR